MDSVTLLAERLYLGRECVAVSFAYGSKHNQYENAAAERVADRWQVELIKIDLTSVMSEIQSDLLKTGGDIPEGHYEAETMTATVVPGRNMIFTSLLTGIAQSRGITELALAVHSGDHAIYPDCRPEFWEAMKKVVSESTEGRVYAVTPFLTMNKTSIIKLGTEIEVPYDLTRTCYKDQPVACGRCGSCQERLEAFAANGLTDPIAYEFREILPKAS
jgi:7-cyano-7-deazaguanine synthase